MTPEERQMLERLLRIAEQNNKMLKKIRRDAVVKSVMHAIYWIAIIGISVAAYYYVKPFIDRVMEAASVVDQLPSFKISPR